MFGVLASGGWAQSLLDPADLLPPADMAVLDSDQVYRALSCQVEPQKPYLGFDLRFHANYHATVPVETLTAGGWLQEVVRVRSKPDGKPVLLERRIDVPSFAAGLKGMGLVDGGVDIGPGRYEIDWTKPP